MAHKGFMTFKLINALQEDLHDNDKAYSDLRMWNLNNVYKGLIVFPFLKDKFQGIYLDQLGLRKDGE